MSAIKIVSRMRAGMWGGAVFAVKLQETGREEEGQLSRRELSNPSGTSHLRSWWLYYLGFSRSQKEVLYTSLSMMASYCQNM